MPVGVSRQEYLVEHVRVRHGSEIDDVLAAIAAGADHAATLGLLGINPRMSPSVLSLGFLFDELGRGKGYRAAVRNKTRSTNVTRYGGVSPMASKDVRQRMQDTVQDRYGVANISQSEAAKQQTRETLLANYGVDSPLKSPLLRARHKESVRARYGVDNVSQAQEIKDAKRDASLARYGVPCTAMDPEVRNKQAKTLREKNPDLPEGAQFPFESQKVRGRAKATMKRRHGHENPFAVPSVQAQIKQTLMDRYGVGNPSEAPEIQARRVETMLERYGVENPFMSEDVKELIRQVNLEKYGVEYVMQLPEMIRRAHESKKSNGTYGRSTVEDDLYELLVGQFGVDDVVRQHHDDRYPFACDFYVRSRDLFVELNGMWSHGGRWFDEERVEDLALASRWLGRGGAYYETALHIWTVSDVAKRSAAREHGLNFVVLWDGAKGLDQKLWAALGFPDGRDWDREYSWLPDRAELHVPAAWPKDLDVSCRVVSQIVKTANGDAFYARERKMWADDDPTLHGRTRGRLYANRLRYLGKLPHELGDVELLRGLGISGRLRAYTTFDNKGMVEVLDRYQPSAVYDPCAGWGERLVTCAALGVGYLGVDVNDAVVRGHDQIVERYGLKEHSSRVADAATHDMRRSTHELVFTCPPYGGIEIYSETGAENLDEQGFLGWWRQVVEMSTGLETKVFAYQVNQKWRSKMNAVLLESGWRLVDQVEVGRKRVSHLNRAKDGSSLKREFEQVQIFER